MQFLCLGGVAFDFHFTYLFVFCPPVCPSVNKLLEDEPSCNFVVW